MTLVWHSAVQIERAHFDIRQKKMQGLIRKLYCSAPARVL